MTDVASPSPVKPLEQIASKDDRFHCVPLRVDMLVLGCVQRQAIVRSGKKRLDWSQCISCELGREIEKKSGGAMVVTQHKNDKKHGGWGANPSGLSYRAKKHLPVLPVVDESANDDGREADPDDATLPTLGASLTPRLASDPADLEADEQENDIQQRDTEPAPPPKRERKTKMAMTPEEKKIKQREWSRNYAAKKRAEREAAAGKPAKKVAPGVTISKPRRGGAPTKWTQRMAAPAPASSSGALAEQLTRAVEAVELVDRIGWDRARTFAAMLDEVRPS